MVMNATEAEREEKYDNDGAFFRPTHVVKREKKRR
jgi:hypothetical protein